MLFNHIKNRGQADGHKAHESYVTLKQVMK